MFILYRVILLVCLKVFQGVLRLASVYVSLCKTGEVSHLKWTDQFHCKPALVGEERLADQLNEQSNRMERCLCQWREEIHAKRMQYSHLNRYTTQQLLLLRKSLADVRNEGSRACEHLPLQVFSLLESVLPGILPSALHTALISSGICSAQVRDTLGTYSAGFHISDLSDSLVCLGAEWLARRPLTNAARVRFPAGDLIPVS